MVICMLHVIFTSILLGDSNFQTAFGTDLLGACDWDVSCGQLELGTYSRCHLEV